MKIKPWKDGKYRGCLNPIWCFAEFEFYECQWVIGYKVLGSTGLWGGLLNKTSLYTLEMSLIQNRSQSVCCVGGEVTLSFLWETKRYRFLQKLIKIRFNWGRPLENLGYKHKNEQKINYETGENKLILWHRNSYEIGWDTINLVGYRVLLT